MTCRYLEHKNGKRVCTVNSTPDEAFIWCEKGNEYKKCHRYIRKVKNIKRW